MSKSSNTTESQQSSLSLDSSRAAISAISGLIFAIGVPGNILVILTICRVTKMRSTQNLFLANLAVGDLVNILWSLPIYVLSIHIPWPFGVFVCKYIYTLNHVITANTVLTMLSIMVDRYRVIVHPFKKRLTFGKTLIFIAITWIVCYIIIAIPLAFSFELSSGFWVNVRCVEKPRNSALQVLRIIIQVSGFSLPCVIGLFCFFRIKSTLQKNLNATKNIISNHATVKRIQSHQKMIRVLLAIIIAFIICYLPFIILVIVDNAVTDTPDTLIALAFCYMLLFANSTVNPVILYLLSNNFKKGYLEQLQCYSKN